MSSTSLSGSAVSHCLTVVITTSPTPSAPSTELLSSVLDSFKKHCPALLASSVIVVFDTYERIVSKERLKKGLITAEGAANFAQYKENVKRLILDTYGCDNDKDGGAEGGRDTGFTTHQDEAEYGWTQRGDVHGEGETSLNSIPVAITKTVDRRVTFVEPAERLGFGLAVRSALRVTETTYVWVHQHDWVLAADIPVERLLDVMEASGSTLLPQGTSQSESEEAQAEFVPVKYISFVSIRMLSYAVSDAVTRYPALRSSTARMKRDFPVVAPSTDSSIGQESEHADGTPTSVPLTPLFFWFDKPHLASTWHYLERVFPTRLALGRGDFIEDKIGHRARDQMKVGLWARWATWLYYPDNGRTLCLKHLQGRTWAGQEGEARKKETWKTVNGVGGARAAT